MGEYHARRRPRDLAGAGWYEILSKPGPARELEGTHRAEWIIIGGGFAGLAAARRLRQLRPGERIALLEAQRVGLGAAGRNSGFMIDLPHDLASESYGGGRDRNLAEIRQNRAGIAFAREAAEEYELGPAIFDPCGKYHGAADDHGLSALRTFERHLDTLGESYTALDAADMKRVTGTRYYAGGSFMPGTVMIQPAAYVRGVANGLGRAVAVFENSPVLRLETGTIHTAHTPKGSISAPRVILTVNGHIESFGFYKRRLMHIFTYASMTRRLTEAEVRAVGGEPAWALIPADPMGSTVRRIAEDRIVVRHTFTYNPSMATTPAQVARIGHHHDASFRARFPMLAAVEMEHRWGGALCLSLNSAAAFGEVAERVYSACCCNGLGTVKGTLGGMLIADLATGTDNPLVGEILRNPQPSRLYPEPFMRLGAGVKLWWMQRRAGAEL